MFDSLNDQALRAAHDAARLLYDNHRALGLDVLAVKLDTLRVDLAVELENRGKPLAPAEERAGPRRLRRTTLPRGTSPRILSCEGARLR
jgi:hypothetical protein